jgi:hypothetical protein
MNSQFASLVVGLAQQAEQALAGELPAGLPGNPDPRQVARAFIDTLEMLEQKTTGHLEPAEHKLLNDILTQLRFRFVAIAGPPGGPPGAA